ncbi:MAG: hypothetical protein WAL16_15230 [Streptosporangiaceae bacterium]
MSPLERRCRLLLRAYPPAYRRHRGEEILGTLLEATPAGRGWPRLRDARSLAMAGLRERAAQNRRLTTAANARTAALIGVVAYLGLLAGEYLSTVARSELEFRGAMPLSWAELALLAFLAASAALAWASRRRVLVLAGVAPAAAIVCLATPWSTFAWWQAVPVLVCLAALLALAGGAQRPSRRWLWPVGIIAAAPFLGDLSGIDGRAVDGRALSFVLVLAVVVVCIAWIAVDARPAIAAAVFLLLVAMTIFGFSFGGPPQVAFLAVVCVLASMALWRLRRQSAHGGGPGATAA